MNHRVVALFAFVDRCIDIMHYMSTDTIVLVVSSGTRVFKPGRVLTSALTPLPPRAPSLSTSPLLSPL